MKNKQIAKAVQAAEIPCLLLPMHEQTLLVPTVTIAEMVPMAPCDKVADSPDWFLGYFKWRGRDVPLVSFELLNGKTGAALSPTGRVAVLNNTGVSDELPFIAIATQGIPRMSRIGEEDIKEDSEAKKRPFELMHVKVGLEELAIPDVSALEHAYLDFKKL